MGHHIRTLVKRQIGGDVQEIASLNSEYSDIAFKHILLPVYASAFKFDGKVYSYVINGRNGDISGKRPYSTAKIAAAVVSALAVAAVIYYFMK